MNGTKRKRGRPPVYGPDEKLDFAREYARGGTYRDVAERLGISIGTLHAAYAQYGERAERERAQWRASFSRAHGRARTS